MTGSPHRTFIPDAKYPTPEAAARELLRIYRTYVTEAWPYAYTGVTNMDFLRGGGTIEEYRSGIDYGTKQGWFSIEAGSRVTVLLT
jgi:hypothetical protein